MTLHVMVNDRAGNPVRGLQEADFTLLDNGHPVRLRNFAAAGSPAPLVVLVMDEVNEPFRALSIEQGQMEKFLSQNQGRLPFPVSLIFLTDSGLQQVKPSTEGNALAALLAKHRAELRAISTRRDLYNSEARLQISLRALESVVDYEAGVPQRKLLIWISQGWPTLDMPEVMLSVAQQRNIYSMAVTTANLLRFTDTTVYSVDPEGNWDAANLESVEWQKYLKPVSRFQQAQYGDLAVQVLATQSGGLVRQGGNDVAQEIDHCTQDASNGYELTFQPQSAEQPNTWHSIQVKVDRHGAMVRARDGYYAQP
jgi:VWFA-related protein